MAIALAIHRKTSKNGIDRFQARCRQCPFHTEWKQRERDVERPGVQHVQMKHLNMLPEIERHYED